MKLKNANFLLICCLAMSALTAKCEEKTLPNNPREDIGDPDDLPSKYEFFSYSKDEVEFKTKSGRSGIEANLIGKHLYGKEPNHARIIFENYFKRVYIVYSCKGSLAERFNLWDGRFFVNCDENGFMSESFDLEEFLFDDDCKNISPLDEKVLWANAISFLGRSFHNFEALNKIKHSNYFLKKHILMAIREILKALHANPILFKKGIVESVQPQTNAHKMIILIRDNFAQGESELENDPIKCKKAIFEISNLHIATMKEREDLEKKDKLSVEYVKILNKDIGSRNLARVIFKNIIEGNKELIRAFPAKVCQKIRELCKDSVENINTLSDKDLEEFTGWICEQAAEVLSKDIVMPWDRK